MLSLRPLESVSRRALKKLIRRMGYDVRRADIGQDAFNDIKEILVTDSPIIFDVGANIGQTVETLFKIFRSPTIHAFEPGQIAFPQLRARYQKACNVYLNNVALGSECGTHVFFENSYSDMSSFLRLGPQGWGQASQTETDVTTIDRYCEENRISQIDLLKSDTQGFDLEVIKGARQMLAVKKIRLIYLELTFAKLYEDMPRIEEIYRFMIDHGFELVSLYRFHYVNRRAGWTDALFVQPGFVDLEAKK